MSNLAEELVRSPCMFLHGLKEEEVDVSPQLIHGVKAADRQMFMGNGWADVKVFCT